MELKQLFILTCILLFAISPASANSADVPVLQIGHITDTHYGQDKANAEARIPLFTSEMNSLGIDFVICTGDMVYDNLSRYTPIEYLITGEEYNERLLRYLSLMTVFDGPVYHMFGNHDVLCQDKFVSIQVLNNKKLDSYFPSNYYYFDSPKSGYRFIILDGQYNSNGEIDLENPAYIGTPFFPSEELAWLEETLQDAKKKKYNGIVFHHLPIKYYTEQPDSQISEIIENSGIVQCVIQGHLHETYIYEDDSGVYYLTSEASADKDHAYSVIEIFKDHSIEISGEINQEIGSPEDEKQQKKMKNKNKAAKKELEREYKADNQ